MNAQRAAFGLSTIASVAALLAGCGAGATSSPSRRSTQSSSTAASKQSRSSVPAEKVPMVNIPVNTGTRLEPIPARYTCDAGDLSLPLRWGRVPADTVETDVFVFKAALTQKALVPVWAVAGLKPNVHRLPAGRLPRGAVVGRNGSGAARYSVCPPRGVTTGYVVLVDPLPRRLPVQPGFDPKALVEEAVHTARFEGRLSFTFKR